MATVLNEIEIAPAPPPEQTAGAAQPAGAGQAQPGSAKKIHKTLQLQQERKLRLAVY